MRSDCEAVPKPFTKADADRAEVLEANLAVVSTSLVTAAVTPGCQVYWPAPFEVCGRIRDKFNQTGGPNGFLLFPKSNELTNPDRVGKRSEFLGGNIYWTAVTDAHPVAHDFLTKWGQYGYEGGFMKYPTTDEIVLGGLDGRRQEFQGTTLFYSIPTGTHNVQGAIRDKYRAIGLNSGQLGYPTTDENASVIEGGKYNIFQFGAIFWSNSVGAHFVNFPIYGVWSNNGFEGGLYGYPIGDPHGDGARPGSAIQDFQKGTITIWANSNPAGDGKCTENNPSGCSEAPFNTLKACRDYEDDLVKGDDIILQFRDSHQSRLVCRDYRAHIIPGHFQTFSDGTPNISEKDDLDFQTCLINAIENGTEWPDSRSANGYITRNTTGVRGKVALDASWKILSAFPDGGDGKDWGGCARDSS